MSECVFCRIVQGKISATARLGRAIRDAFARSGFSVYQANGAAIAQPKGE